MAVVFPLVAGSSPKTTTWRAGLLSQRAENPIRPERDLGTRDQVPRKSKNSQPANIADDQPGAPATSVRRKKSRKA